MLCTTLFLCTAAMGLELSETQQGSPPAAQAQESGEVTRPQTQSSEVVADEDYWLDRWQDNLTDSLDYTARQLDSFFALEGSDEYKNARAEGRISVGWEPRSRDLAETDVRFRIRVKLPALQNRVDLLLSDNEDYDQEDTIKAAREPAFRRGDRTTLALRFKQEPDSHLSYRIGAGRRDQLYAKTRFEDMVAFNSSLAMRYDAELYYYTRDRLGAELGTSFQYITPKDNVMRFNNRFYFRDETNDWLWRHELQYLQPLDQQSAAIYSFFTEGLSQPNYRIEEVYTSIRWRTNPHREWLFYEVEPFVVWLRDEDFKPSYGLALRVEVYYGKPY